MNIDAKQLASKPRKIGKHDGKDISLVITKGGFHMVVSPKDGSFETLGTGPHEAVAKYIASKRKPDIQWLEMRKADHVSMEHFSHVLPKYEAITDQLRKLHGDDE